MDAELSNNLMNSSNDEVIRRFETVGNQETRQIRRVRHHDVSLRRNRHVRGKKKEVSCTRTDVKKKQVLNMCL